MLFKKRFNVGLTLDTNTKEFTEFLHSYAPYINEIYFSVPLGERFQTRKNIDKQFSDPSVVKTYWELLKIVKQFNIRLELVLNTFYLSEQDIYFARQLLDDHNISVDSVCFVDKYYDWVKKYFPGNDYVFSYNNALRTIEEIEKIENKYDYYVVGNSNIRNNEILADLKKKGKTILLLNNGCSFNCLSCRVSSKCKEIFESNLSKHGLDYLYALQSVMPFEIHDGTINVENVDMFKISNRSSDIKYLKKCLDSYIENSAIQYIEKSPKNLALWCRLGHFWRLFDDVNFENVIKFKKQILGHEIAIK